MSEMINPYIAGAPVTETRMFFGREDIFNWIQNSLSGQYTDHILVIHGQRRVGKTSVLKQLGNRLPKKYVPVFFDLQGRTHTTLDRFMWWLARETVRVLKQVRNLEVPIPNKEDFSKDPEYFENVFLPGLKPFLGEHILLFTFDEFDNLEESEVKEELARPLIDNLRRMMSRDDMSFIFSIGSSGRKLENMQAAYTEFFKTALYKKISFLSEEQTRGLITQPVEGLLQYDNAVVKHIFELASGHPYFTQLTCHELFARCQRTDQRRLKNDDLNAILDDVVERGTVNLKFTWDESTDIEKWSLAALAHLDKSDNRTLADFLRKQRVRFSDADLTSGLLHLREKDVLTNQNHFVIFLLKLWLLKNRPIEQVREELIEVNPIANRYIEIGLEFKDSGMYEKSLESFQEALTIAPGNVQAQVNIAQVYMVKKVFDKAVNEFERVLEIDDENVVARGGLCDAHLALGDAALGRGRLKEAILSYQRVLSINKEHLEARQRMADISRQYAEKALVGGKDEDALNAFREALKFTPEDPNLIKQVQDVREQKKAKVLELLTSRSKKEAEARNWDKAISTLNEALELSNQDASILKKIDTLRAMQMQERLDAILSKANQAEKTSHWDSAIAALNDYLELKPDEVDIQKRLTELVKTRHVAWLEAILLRSAQATASEKWDQAITILNEVLTLEPDNQEIQTRVVEIREAQRKAKLKAILRQAEAAVHAQKWDEAVSALNQGLIFEPNNTDIQSKIVEVREAKRAARLQAAFRLADTSAQTGKWELAIQALHEILTVEPDNEQVQHKLAQVQAQQHESQLKALRTQVQTLAKAEKFEQALSTWEQYLALEPDDREKAQAEIDNLKKMQTLANLYAEAQIAFSKKNYEKTIKVLKEIIEQDVNYKNASLLFAQAIELRTERKWWQNKWLLGVAVSLVVVFAGWFAIRSSSPLMAILSATPSVSNPTSEIIMNEPVEVTEKASIMDIEITEEPLVALPYSWARLNSGQFLPRDQVTAIVVNPSDSGVMYVGMKNAGVYKTIDGGLSWFPILSGLNTVSVGTLTIDPQNPSTIYAGILKNGLYKTIDGGQTWHSLGKGVNGGVASVIVIDPNNFQHLYYAPNRLEYESFDGGETWSEIKQKDNCPDQVGTFTVHPLNGNTLYAGQWGSGQCELGVYKSEDAGKTWVNIGANQEGISSISIELDPDGTPVLLASSDRESFVSHDDGQSWVTFSKCSNFTFDPENKAIIYCGNSNGLKKSINSGNNWQDVTEFGNNKVTFITVIPSTNGQTLIVGGEGLFISRDGGKTWATLNSGLGSARVDLSFDVQDPTTIFLQGGLDVRSLYRTTDGGHTWDIATDKGTFLALDANGKNIYRLGDNGMLVSQDQGESWTSSNTMPSYNCESISANSITPGYLYTFCGDNNGILKLLYSLDFGNSWLESSYNFSAVHFPRFFFSGEQGQVLYALAHPEVTATRSEDSGTSWQKCDQYPGSSRAASALAIHPDDPKILYLATPGNGIFISHNGCQSWQESNNGLASLSVSSIDIDPNDPNMLYAGTDGGAYISLNGGESWGQVNDGLLGATVVYSIVVDNDSNVYAATPYGIFKLESK